MTAPRLSQRQRDLLQRVCLRRYTVVFDHYMGSFRPSESVRVTDEEAEESVGGEVDRSFRPATVHALVDQGLVRKVPPRGPGGAPVRYADHSIVKPTDHGLEVFRALRARDAS